MHYWAVRAPRTFFVDRRDAPLGLAELGRVDIVNQASALLQARKLYHTLQTCPASSIVISSIEQLGDNIIIPFNSSLVLFSPGNN